MWLSVVVCVCVATEAATFENAPVKAGSSESLPFPLFLMVLIEKR